jgi:hypothetical protein
MLDILGIILSTYFLGKMVAAKGYDSLRWRVRHVCACIFVETLVGMISLYLTKDFLIASLSGFVALAGIILYRYQTVKNLPVHKP